MQGYHKKIIIAQSTLNAEQNIVDVMNYENF